MDLPSGRAMGLTIDPWIGPPRACGRARGPTRLRLLRGTLCCTSDDGAHLQSSSASMLDRRRDLSELRFSA
jgi:hypothetical protein